MEGTHAQMKGLENGRFEGIYSPHVRCLVLRRERYARCFAAFWALSALAFCLFSVRPSYADGMNQVIYGPISYEFNDVVYTEVGVTANNKYDAALIALGYNLSDSRFDSDVKAYLSNETTGGAFYSFAQLFTNPPTDGTGLTNPGYWSTAYALYGAGKVWHAEYTLVQRVAAITTIGLILAGDVPGGGGSGGGSVGDTVTLDTMAYKNEDQQLGWQGQVVYNLSGVDYYNFTPYNDRMLANDTVTFTLNEQLQTVLNDYLSDGGTTIIDFGSKITNSGNKRYNCSIQHYPDGISVSMEDVKVDKHGVLVDMPGYFKVVNSSNYQLKYYQFTVTQDTSSASYVVDTGTYTERTSNISGNNSVDKILSFYGTIVDGSSGPVVPPTNWPTDPTPIPPTEPTVPNPPTYGTPTQPTIPGPTADPVYGNQTIYITSTFTADFQGIIDALDEHCRHLQNALYNNMSDFYTKLTTKMTNDFTTLRTFLHGEFGYIVDSMVDIADDMMDYLNDLFEWLAEQFDFSVSGGGYDDNTVVSWLKKIYSKLGGGVNTRPTDPVSDPIGFGDWLNQLLQNFVLDLLAMGQNVLADLVESFRELITKFPFSIPWDIAAFLALLVAEPVAPNIDWPLYTISGNGLVQVATCEIDLTEYDSVMGGVRAMETLLFACWLAFKIDFFKGVMNGIGGTK